MSATTRSALAARAGLSATLGRPLKLAAACAVLVVGGYAIWSAQRFVVSDNAVVSAYVMSLRAPIEGYVSGHPAAIGREIHGGDILATMTNPLADDQRLVDFEERVNRLTVEQATLLRQRDTLEATRRDLLQRAEEHRHAMVAKLSGQVASAHGTRGQLAESEQAKRDSIARSTWRAREQHRPPIWTRAFRIRRTGTPSALAGRAAHRLPGGTRRGPRYSDRERRATMCHTRSQRADEVPTAPGRTRPRAGHRTGGRHRRRFRAGSRTSQADHAPLGDDGSTVAGMLWKLGASTGERIGTEIRGGTGRLRRCVSGRDHAAEGLHEHCATAAMRGSVWRVKRAERTGRIMSITGDASLIGDRNLAAVPPDQHQPTVMVRIEVPPSPNSAAECLVGRTARILLPTSAAASWRQDIAAGAAHLLTTV